MKATDLILPEKLYVGIQGREPLNTETFPLGFCTPYEDTKQFLSRKETIDNWVGNPYDYQTKTFKFKDKYEGHILDNVPIEGFTLDRVVSRWSTSNKYYRINDPRGFQLEISTENLADILINYGCSKGVLEGHYVWARHNSKVYLLHSRSELYNTIVNRDLKRELKIGDKIITKNSREEVYIGKCYIINFSKNKLYRRKDEDEWSKTPLYGWGYHKPQEKIVYSIKKDKTPWHIFYNKDYKGNPSYDIKRKIPKYDLIKENSEYVDISNGYKDYVYSNYGLIYFKTLEEMKSYNIDNFDVALELQKVYDKYHK